MFRREHNIIIGNAMNEVNVSTQYGENETKERTRRRL